MRIHQFTVKSLLSFLSFILLRFIIYPFFSSPLFIYSFIYLIFAARFLVLYFSSQLKMKNKQQYCLYFLFLVLFSFAVSPFLIFLLLYFVFRILFFRISFRIFFRIFPVFLRILFRIFSVYSSYLSYLSSCVFSPTLFFVISDISLPGRMLWIF